jgi:hypothetical protein
MKKSLITLAAVALVSGAAFAQDPDPSGQFAQQVDSSLTRAEVNAQVFAAVKAGETSPSKIPLIGKVQPKLASSTTRAEVTAQYLAERDQADAMVTEDSGASYFAKATPRHAIPEVVTGH